MSTAILPDYLLDPNAVLKDDAEWRNGSAPDYSVTNEQFNNTKTTSWETTPESIEFLVQNLVKNWEKEASFKKSPKEWRTTDTEKYSFHLSSGPSMSGEDMVRLGTYNALFPKKGVPGVYEPEVMTFEKSHTAFKTVMKRFTWEVLEVYGAPPTVSVKWRHWGTMTGDYVAKLADGRTVTAPATGKKIEIFGITVATVDDQFRITKLDTFWDHTSLFEQLAPNGVELVPGDSGVTCPIAHGV